MSSPRSSVALLAIIAGMAALSIVFFYGLLFGPTSLGSQGTVTPVGVGVYWETACTTKVTAIDWGFLEPGATKSVTIYIRNEAGSPMHLQMTVGNWSSGEAAAYITPSWSCEGSPVSVGSVLPAVITVAVSPDVSGVSGFSYEMTIMGTD